MVLLIDNYDSFTYNLYQYIMELGYQVMIRRNDQITPEAVKNAGISHIVLSPGPGRPEHAGCIVDLVKHFGGTIPILGVCLGHQAIGYAYGAEITYSQYLFHGKSSAIYHDGKGIFNGIHNPFTAIRYHSLIISRPSLPEGFEISAWTESGEIMGIRHKRYSIEGVQFHPESIGTSRGRDILGRFLNGRVERKCIQSALSKVCGRVDLDKNEAEQVMGEIASGDATAAQIAAILTALSMKGECAQEIAGFAAALRKRATPIPRPLDCKIVDTCGTGGDGKGTFNVSTAAALVAAGAGVPIAKHGNRSITSRCGSADLLEALGVNVNAGPQTVAQSLSSVGIAFLFAPVLHHAMKSVAPVRRELGIPTLFNILGPLANPASAEYQVIGVFSKEIMDKVASALKLLDVERALVIHGSDGVDEITCTGPTDVIELDRGWLKRYELHPSMVGLPCSTLDAVQGGTLKKNCDIVLAVLSGSKGPCRDVVVFNAAAAIYLYGLAEDVKEGVLLAERSIDSGAAFDKLQALVRATQV